MLTAKRMASVGEQGRRVHEPPRSALRACKEDVCAESDERYATASITFSVERKIGEGAGSDDRMN